MATAHQLRVKITCFRGNSESGIDCIAQLLCFTDKMRKGEKGYIKRERERKEAEDAERKRKEDEEKKRALAEVQAKIAKLEAGGSGSDNLSDDEDDEA